MFDLDTESIVPDTPGRVLLAYPTPETEPSPACAEDTERRDAPRRDAMLDLDLACLGPAEDLWQSVVRHKRQDPPTGDVATDARAVLQARLDRPGAELADTGYAGLDRSTGSGKIGIRDIYRDRSD